MARYTIAKCDRCKREIRVGDSFTLELYRSDCTHDLMLDLCPDCYEKLHEGFLGLGEVKWNADK